MVLPSVFRRQTEKKWKPSQILFTMFSYPCTASKENKVNFQRMKFSLRGRDCSPWSRFWSRHPWCQGRTVKVPDPLWPWSGSSQRYWHHIASLTSWSKSYYVRCFSGGWWNPWTTSSEPAHKLGPHTAQLSHFHGVLHGGQIYLVIWASYRLLIERMNIIQRKQSLGYKAEYKA